MTEIEYGCAKSGRISISPAPVSGSSNVRASSRAGSRSASTERGVNAAATSLRIRVCSGVRARGGSSARRPRTPASGNRAPARRRPPAANRCLEVSPEPLVPQAGPHVLVPGHEPARQPFVVERPARSRGARSGSDRGCQELRVRGSKVSVPVCAQPPAPTPRRVGRQIYWTAGTQDPVSVPRPRGSQAYICIEGGFA